MQKRFSLSAAVVAAVLAMCPAIGPARAQTEINSARSSINLDLGSGTTVRLERPFNTALIGDSAVIDFQAQDDRSVLLKPLRLGTTNLVFVDTQGVVITNLTIVVRQAPPI
jgi:Flp pilus assembly secretin CpaC